MRLQSFNRVLVAGAAGAGKSTLARAISQALELEYTELDSLYFGENWTERRDFLLDVRRLAERASWVTEWQYPVAREILLANCDLLVWIDLPRSQATFQAFRRSVRRRHDRAELWNGNYEQPLSSIFSNRYHTVRWSWRHHGEVAHQVETAREMFPDLRVVHLRSHREGSDFLRALAAAKRRSP